MTIFLDSDLGAAVSREAQQKGVSPELLVVDILRDRFLNRCDSRDEEAQDEWERRLLALPIDCGTTLADEVLSRDEMYD